jgi:uncharacterized protein YcfJ
MVDWKKAGLKAWETRKKNNVTELLNDKGFMETLKTVQSMRLHKNYVKGLERYVGSTESYKEKLYLDIASKISGIRADNIILNAHATKEYLTGRANKEQASEARRSVCTLWSDHHFGTNVNSTEMSGTNEYNWTVAARRLGMVCEETATYKESRRKYHDELVIFLIGDLIGGVIHNQEGNNYDLMINQIIGATQYYIQAIKYLKVRGLYPKIRVYCQPGNHGRVQHKADRGRAMVQKYDSLENIIFYNLALAFKDDKQVEINVPKAPFCDVDVQGHRVFATHGDTVFLTGNVGNTINTRAIEQKVSHINAAERDRGNKPYALFLAGHVHHAAVLTTSTGVKIVINSCLIGNEPYGLSLGFHSTVPSQHLFETTSKYVFGDNRFLEVRTADNNKDFEDIIRPYNGDIQ